MNGQRQAISEAYLADEDDLLGRLIQKARMSPAEEAVTAALARTLIAKVRALKPHASGVDAFTQEYALSSDEGVMLMCLAEALLRVPDADTQDRLIRDKLAGQDWERHLGHSHSPFVNASTWALMLTGRIVEGRDVSRWDFDAIWRNLMARLGEPVIRQAVISAVKLLGQHFVLGRTIEEAIEKSRDAADRGFRFSFDMLGEAAMTRTDAGRYLDRYRHAVQALSNSAQRSGKLFEQPGISVKLTALYPRFEYFKRNEVMAQLLGPLAKLCA
jgi:RHH-type transcriptional regulator, proline utilization regulon repressor / proline dehydrogenase / delta 1-pyrroline-5-carboxylate dehydrogenase